LPRPHVVALETVGTYRWLWDLLEPIVDEIHLADATSARALAGRRSKTDRDDATNLAELLMAGRLPLAWAPPAHVTELRDWARQRYVLGRGHARVLHRVQTLLAINNRPGPRRLKADSLIRYIRMHGEKLPGRHVQQLWMAVDRLTVIERQVDLVERHLDELLASEPFREVGRRLQTIPGVGPIVAATVLAEIGDFQRFPNREAIVRYAGLTPKVFASGGTVRTGRITKAGPPPLRWVLQQAAWVAIRCDDHIRGIWLRIGRQTDAHMDVGDGARSQGLQTRRLSGERLEVMIRNRQFE